MYVNVSLAENTSRTTLAIILPAEIDQRACVPFFLFLLFTQLRHRNRGRGASHEEYIRLITLVENAGYRKVWKKVDLMRLVLDSGDWFA